MSGRIRTQRRSAVRFDTTINGERVCLAGSGRYGVLSLALTWVRHDPRERPELKSAEKWCREECNLRIGALTGGFQESWEKVPVRAGDEITIRILGPGLSEIPPVQSRAIRPKTGPREKHEPTLPNAGESGAQWENNQTKDTPRE